MRVVGKATFFVALAISLGASDAFAPANRAAARCACLHRVAVPIMCEYSTKVKMTAETRAPLRQARIFFLYPATVAGASIAAYVSSLRMLSGQGELSDSGNLLVNLGVVAAAFFGARTDLKGREELLQQVAIELGEAESVPEAESDAAGLQD